jgi:PilZ domain
MHFPVWHQECTVTHVPPHPKINRCTREHMGDRLESRVQLESQGSLCGMNQGRPFLEPVIIRNISGRGLLVEVGRCFARPGDIVVVRHGQYKGRFEVIRVQKTPHGKELGLRHSSPATLFWGFDLPLPAPDSYRRPRIQTRRHHPRYIHELAVEVRLENSRVPIWSTTSDINEAGCFVHMLNAVPISARLDIALWIGAAKIWAQGVVVSSVGGYGTGIRFLAISQEGCQRLRKSIASCPRVRDRRSVHEANLVWNSEMETYSEPIEWREALNT